MPKYDLLNTDKNIDNLKNQIFKLMPIREGKNLKGEIVYDDFTAYIHYKKNLTLLINKVLGASEIWFENQYWRDMLLQLEGLLKFDYPHEQFRQIIFYCTNDLCEKMKLREGMRDG